MMQYLPHGPFGDWDAIISYMPWTKTGILTTEDYVDEAISGKADLSAIPSNTSQLSNDSSFITSADISSKADISSVPSFSIDGQVGDLEIQHVSMQEYEQILEDGPLSNVLYIVSGEYESAFGKQIKNLSAGTDLSDAVNLEQVTQISSSLYQHFDGLMGNLESLINSL